ncbi:MAG: ornithine carbamoyltransferase, partial [Pleurocapsa sp.]
MKQLKGRDLLGTADLNTEEIIDVLDLAQKLKSKQLEIQSNKVLGLLFYKASTRTRVSFSVAMYKLGGQVIDLNPSVTQVGRGEPIEDT